MIPAGPRALTLTQPYATLIAIQAKRIETRGWTTSYRGALYIHAGKGLDPVGGPAGLRSLLACQPFASVLAEAVDARRLAAIDALPRGAVVAVAQLVSVVPAPGLVRSGGAHWTAPTGRAYRFDLTPQERAFGDYGQGRYGWLLADVVALAEPVPCTGAQGLWTPPPAVVAAVRAQLP